MSNVIKMTDKKKKPDINKWKAQIEEYGDRLTDRMNDAIRLADEEANDEGIPEELADCAMLGVFASMIVTVTAQRKIVGPDALIKLIRAVVAERQRERRDDTRADD